MALSKNVSETEYPIEELGPNAGYVAELFKLYQNGSPLVDPSWRQFFGGEVNGASSPSPESLLTQAKVVALISSFRSDGHLAAKSNPFKHGQNIPEVPRSLDISSYHFTPEQLRQSFFTAGFGEASSPTLADLIAKLEQTYCGTIGFEIEHITDLKAKEWLRKVIEQEFAKRHWFSTQMKLKLLERLLEAELLDTAFHTKFVGAKRFSLLGGETFAAVMQSLLEAGAKSQVKDVLLAMAHRGRISALVSFAGKPLNQLVAEFEDKTVASEKGGGDVKYHLGWTTEHALENGKVRLSIPPNPSHLEFVSSVATGVIRARQDWEYKEKEAASVAVLVHGDASFAGQGIVAEIFNYSRLPGYQTGGSVHIIINNQVGFTTSAFEARSTTYCSDLAKGFDAPVFHINGDDIEAAAWAADLAMRYRAEFRRDVVLDVVCSRKFGHNEGDDPSFTQPRFYKELADRKPVGMIYGEALIKEGLIDAGGLQKVRSDIQSNIRAQFEAPREPSDKRYDFSIKEADATSVKEEILGQVTEALLQVPTGFEVHPKVRTIIGKRIQSLTQPKGIDWGLGEALAYGTLLLDGVSIRLSGQDAGRGTFSHRHLELHDARTDERVLPLQEFAKSRGLKSRYEVYNSPLSEAAVLGFEFGYAAERPQSLVLWEAQFGDFVNGAQVIVDQFLAASEQKWNQRSGVVLLLPHGYEGQGPEHSSARLERFLQLCSHNNMTVAYPSSPAQYFHLLRRQALSEVKRPLVVMTPKSMLRLPDAGSNLADFTSGGFRKVIASGSSPSEKKQVFLCSGKIYYEIRKAVGDAASVLRLEQLYPWPESEIAQALGSAKKITWVQEEPENMGAARYVVPLLQQMGKSVAYIGRETSASVAAGSPKWHAKELSQIIDAVRAALA